MSFSNYLSEIQNQLSIYLIILVGISIFWSFFRAITRKKVSLTNLSEAWPLDHTVHLHPHQWELWRVELKKGLKNWFYPSYLATDTSGRSRGVATFYRNSRKEYLMEDRGLITSPAKSRYSLDPHLEFYLGGSLLAKATSNFVLVKNRLELQYQGRTIFMREMSNGIIQEGWAFYENETLIAETRRLSDFVGGPRVFCFQSSIDDHLRGLIILLGIT